jgi:hypothetical protein
MYKDPVYLTPIRRFGNQENRVAVKKPDLMGSTSCVFARKLSQQEVILSKTIAKRTRDE